MVIAHLVKVRQFVSAVLHVVTMETKRKHILGHVHKSRSQRPCGLRRGSAAFRSLAGIVGSDPAEASMFVSCECCVLSDRGLCDGLITRAEKSYRVRCVRV